MQRRLGEIRGVSICSPKITQLFRASAIQAGCGLCHSGNWRHPRDSRNRAVHPLDSIPKTPGGHRSYHRSFSDVFCDVFWRSPATATGVITGVIIGVFCGVFWHRPPLLSPLFIGVITGVICDVFAIFADVRVIPGLRSESRKQLTAASPPPALQGRCNLAFCWRCKPSGAAANVRFCQVAPLPFPTRAHRCKP